MGARPLRTSVAVQRETDATGGNESATTAQPAAIPEAVPFSWAPASALPETVTAIPAAARALDAVPLQRLPDPGSAAASTQTQTGATMREITFPAAAALGALPGITAGDPFAGPGLPGPATLGGAPAGPAAPASVQRASSTSPASTPSGTRRAGASQAAASSEPLALARPHLAAAASTAATIQSHDGFYGARMTADGGALTVQTSPASATAGTTAQLPAFTATPVVQRVEGAAPSGGDTKSGHSDTELDELAKAIFGRISNRLRTEVIHEREAKGLTFDAF